MSESNNLKEIQLNCPKEATLFRNNCGIATYVNGGMVSKVKYGVGGDGGSDLIGGTRIIITPDMVGRQLFVLTAPEVKTEDELKYILKNYEALKNYIGTDKKKERISNQIHFIEFVRGAGGIALFATKSEDVIKCIDEFNNIGHNALSNKE